MKQSFSAMSSDKGVAFDQDEDAKYHSQLYQDLCNRMRPSNLNIPPTSPRPKIIKKFVPPAPYHTDSLGTSLDQRLDGKPSGAPDLMRDERTPSSESNDDTVRLLLCVSSLQLPSSNIIPEGRTRTPRTPRTPSDCRRRRTLSPVDECRGKNSPTTPTEYLIHRYKAMTPKRTDFTM